jgi:DNA-binding response OmpR family regulator
MQQSSVRQRAVSRVLLVEDDDDLRAVIAERFRAAGFDVVEVDDGTGMAEYLAESLQSPQRRADVDLLVSDVPTPGLMALEILQGARGLPSGTPVILMTAFGDEATHDRALGLGAAAVFDKPFDVGALVAAARRLLCGPSSDEPHPSS